jgi:hypothetical protein
MRVDLDKFSEDELLDLNHRIVERLQLIRSAKRLSQLARFSVGMTVEFEVIDDGRTLRGPIVRLNRQTATVVTAAGRWRIAPSLLRLVDANAVATAASERIVPFADVHSHGHVCGRPERSVPLRQWPQVQALLRKSILESLPRGHPERCPPRVRGARSTDRPGAISG